MFNDTHDALDEDAIKTSIEIDLKQSLHLLTRNHLGVWACIQHNPLVNTYLSAEHINGCTATSMQRRPVRENRKSHQFWLQKSFLYVFTSIATLRDALNSA